MKKLGDNSNYMTVVFILLLILCSPLSIMAEDYVDCLDVNAVPPENSQYWIAPFVESFMKKNIALIDKNCFDYLGLV